MKRMSLEVSVLIINWNTKDILRDCLHSVYETTPRDSLEVIVVDNASQDGSVEMVKNEFPAVKLVANSSNVGFAKANNQGIKAAQGRYVLLLNSDTVVLGDAIAETITFADANADAGVVGCRVLNADRTLQPTCFMFPSALNILLSSTYLYKLFPRSKLFGREHMTWWKRDDVREVDVVTGCFMLIRRDVFDKIGLLDTDYFMYGEETDFCYRCKKAGFRNYFYPSAQIIHLGGASSRQMEPAMILQARASILLFLRKHRGYVPYSLACIFFAVGALSRVPYWLAKALTCRQGRRSHLSRAKTYAASAFKLLRGWQALRYDKVR